MANRLNRIHSARHLEALIFNWNHRNNRFIIMAHNCHPYRIICLLFILDHHICQTLIRIYRMLCHLFIHNYCLRRVHHAYQLMVLNVHLQSHLPAVIFLFQFFKRKFLNFYRSLLMVIRFESFYSWEKVFSMPICLHLTDFTNTIFMPSPVSTLRLLLLSINAS